MNGGGNAAAVVGYGDRAFRVEGHQNGVAMAGQRLVDGIIDHFVDHVMQTGAVIGIADIHAGPFAYRFQPFQDLDRIRAVLVGARVVRVVVVRHANS